MGCCGQKRSQAMGLARVATAGAMPGTVVGSGSGVGVGAVAAAGAGIGGAMWPSVSPGGSASRAQAALQGARTVTLRLRERARVVVRGPITGRAYAFGSESATQPVDARDAEALLRTRRFERV
ncbi:hypothetical protein BH11PSE8_BH11PSE8_21010 [soil metagenome]